MSAILQISAYRDDADKIRWRATDETNEILAKCPTGYSKADDMVDDLRLLLTNKAEPLLYQDKGSRWRWQIFVATEKEQTTKIAAIAAKGYSNRSDCMAASKLFLEVEGH